MNFTHEIFAKSVPVCEFPACLFGHQVASVRVAAAVTVAWVVMFLLWRMRPKTPPKEKGEPDGEQVCLRFCDPCAFPRPLQKRLCVQTGDDTDCDEKKVSEADGLEGELDRKVAKQAKQAKWVQDHLEKKRVKRVRFNKKVVDDFFDKM